MGQVFQGADPLRICRPPQLDDEESSRLAISGRRGFPSPRAVDGYGRLEPMYQRHHRRRGEPGALDPDPPRRRAAASTLLSHCSKPSATTARPDCSRAKPSRTAPASSQREDRQARPDGLRVISVNGKHSDELKRLYDTKARIDTVETASVVGENSLVTITVKNCRVRRYWTDDTKD
jgi:hypothetical protein